MTKSFFATGVGAVLLGIAAMLAGCGAASSASTPSLKPTPTTAPTPSPTPDISTVANTYSDANNLLNSTLAPLITAENKAAIGSAALTNSLNGQAAAYQAFDTTISGLDVSAFPNVSQDVRAVESADAALATAYGTLAANDTNVTNYNGVFATLTTAEAQFSSANALAVKDLGLVYNTPAP